MEQKISIPKPCHEDWNSMLPEIQGRHCLSCSKTVVDFSSWEPGEIAEYLSKHQEERVCGRFNAEQVATDRKTMQDTLLQRIVRSGMPFYRKVAAIIVLCLSVLSSEDLAAQKVLGRVASPKTTQGQPKHTNEPIIKTDTIKTVEPDSLRPQTRPQIMGMIAPYRPGKSPAAPPKKGNSKKK